MPSPPSPIPSPHILTFTPYSFLALEARVAMATFLAEHAARRRGARIPDGEAGAQLALLVRGGCSLYPDAYLLTVVDRAIAAELPKLPRR